jgi:hypothetical protein
LVHPAVNSCPAIDKIVLVWRVAFLPKQAWQVHSEPLCIPAGKGRAPPWVSVAVEPDLSHPTDPS